jgi:YVTN family beta-propeller protein
VNLSLIPARPAIVGASPDSLVESPSAANVNLTGGYFSSTVSAFFDGLGAAQKVSSTAGNSPTRQLSVTIPAQTELATPGLYPVVLQNSALAPPAPGMSAVNFAVEPAIKDIPTAASATLTVGVSPSSVALNLAAGTAIVTNKNDNTVSVINLLATPPVVTATIPVGHTPTGVAVDDVLSPALALVVNNADNTVSVINLNTNSVTSTVSLAGFTPAGSAPLSIGVSNTSHRALVANQNTNQATVIDLLTPNPAASCNAAPCPLFAVGGSQRPVSTGQSPQVGIDPRLNWAVTTAGGGGTITFIDLGRAATAGDSGRNPLVVGTLNISTTIEGIGINTETHRVLLGDPSGPANLSPGVATFSLLNDAVSSFSTELGFTSAAINSLTNVGVVVNTNANSATIFELANGIALQTVSVGTSPVAVAVDQVSGNAVVVNQGDGSAPGSVSILSLGSRTSGGSFRTLHIVEASPAITFTPPAGALTLTINGSGFGPGSQVLLDGAPVPIQSVSANGRQIVVSVPAAMLGSARRYVLLVQNAAGSPPSVLSNASDLTVIQPVSVGNSPFGVAIDTDRDLAVVTNSGDNTVSLVQLTTGTVVAPPIPVGTSPQGVAVISRLGAAVVANNGSASITAIDETGALSPATAVLCATTNQCIDPTGIATNSDLAQIAVTSNNQTVVPATGNVNFFSLATGTITPTALGLTPNVDQDPTALAMDPDPLVNVTAVACGLVPTSTTTQAGSIDIVTPGSSAIQDRIAGLEDPTGVLFDPLNQVFLVANSASNNIVILDPSTLTTSVVNVGIDPTSIDYNFQTSTLVTVNSASNTMSVVDYLCPPNGTTCPAPQVRTILGVNGSQPFSTLLQFAVAIDPKLNLAVVVDPANHRVLLVPLPH